ncbi:MAG: thymidine kinase [archaeon]
MADISPKFNQGYLEVFAGPMNCGKSRELINKIDRLHYMPEMGHLLVKPKIDTRDVNVKTRFGNLEFACETIDEMNPKRILEIVKPEYVVIGIEEAEFFHEGIVEVVQKLMKQKKYVLVSGLDTDFRGEPFGYMPQLMAIANEVHKLTAACQYEVHGKKCGQPATRTQRLIDGKPAPYKSPIILIGDKTEGYQPRCLKHHYVPGKK